MRQIFVVDPGMMEAGGHHAALLSTLTSYNDVAGKNITLVTHKQIDTSLANIAMNNKVSVIPHFETNFYEHYGNTSGLKEPNIQRYVRTLACEYLNIFNRIANKENPDSNTSFFYPCLNWEHALALNLALAYLVKQKAISLISQQHKVCCMFTPSNQEAAFGNLLYKQAFKRLSQHNCVELYASDFETQQFYKKLGLPILGIHPCYLLPWGQITRSNKHKNTTPKILLYLGDAKESKGFNELPELAIKLLQKYNYEVTLVVQYTLAWDYPELKQSIIDLDKLSAEYKQLRVYKKFWAPDRLVREFGHVDMIYCTYCPNAYRNKSSGLAWLASFFDVPVVLKEGSWLTREFGRLGHHFFTLHNNNAVASDGLYHSESVTYSHSLFSNLIEWLQK